MFLASIIIPSWNGRDMLRECLKSIEENTTVPHEIIVIDNGSTDGTAEMVEKNYPHVRLIKNKENLGFPKAVNQGIRYAKGKDFVIFNNDIETRSVGWLKNLIEIAYSDERIGIVGARMFYPDGKEIKPKRDYVIGACMLIKRNVVNKVGLFDESFSPILFEDKDYCFRARKMGYKVAYCNKTVVIHHASQTIKRMPHYEIYHTNRLKFQFKHKLFNPINEIKTFLWEGRKGNITGLLKAYLDFLKSVVEKR